MTDYYVRTNILILTEALPVVICAIRFKMFDNGTRMFAALCTLNLITESLAYYMAVKYGNNIMVYNIADIMEVVIICQYLNYLSPILRKKRRGLFITAFTAILGIINVFILQPVNQIPEYFLFFQALLTISLSILSLYPYLMPDNVQEVTKEVHFWLPVSLILSSSLTYLLFVVIKVYTAKHIAVPFITTALYLVTIVTNISRTVIFFLYPKMKSYVK